MRKASVTNVLLGLMFLALIAQPLVATANHQPADKVVANGVKVVTVDGENPGAEPDGTTILTSTFKTSGPTDLMVSVSLECAILTTLNNTGGSNGGRTSFTEAEGRIRVWLEFDGKEVAINQVSESPQSSDEPEVGVDQDRVTFCLNERNQRLTDMEEDEGGAAGGDGHDSLSTYLRTKQANAFNWIIMNTGGWGGTAAGHNIHTLEVKAALTTRVIEQNGTAEADGFVGNRTVIVEPTKMSNHASV